MSAILRKLREEGPGRTAAAVWRRLARPLHELRTRHLPAYRDPSDEQLAQVERELGELGVHCGDYAADETAFAAFKQRLRFPVDYHGGESGAVYEEKLLEHFVAWDLLGLSDRPQRWPYVDIASASSPWASILRAQGFEAFSMDLAPHPSLARLPYTITSDATASPFESASVGSASLQCAYEMFAGDADIRLLAELARILKPGGRVVISPLYTHVEACYYQSPEHAGRPLGDAGATAYVRRDAHDVPCSRKYSARSLLQRVIEPARRAGLRPGVLVLRNKRQLGAGIYLHFILVLDKPAEPGA
ncbi:MAG: methyltransferase domain-containing protein [Piscinibacter sp.]|uniref:methyltransferase domain-containing protein n=1 Tax=Piscinibacter sp. TaxID=1903157 RepID=UPI003D13380C